MRKADRVIRIGVTLLALVLFCLWLQTQEEPLSVGTVFALCSVVLFTATLVVALSRLMNAAIDQDLTLPGALETPRQRFFTWGPLLLFGLVVTLCEYIAVYLISRPPAGFFRSFSELYYRADVAHYMGIAEEWYVSTGDERFRLVFLPLYPLMIRLLTWNGDFFSGAFLASQVFSLACLPAVYELFRMDMDRRRAMACARILFLLPGAAFLRVPMSEGLFLFLTLLAVYFARKKRFMLAGLFTGLSAFTRSLGILLLGLLMIEMLLEFLPAYRKNRAAVLRRLPRYLGGLLIGCCGTLTYLAINWRVSGSPFTFLIYQRENWNQQLGFFFNTAAYQAEYAIRYWKDGDMESVLSLSLPNLLCIFGALGLLFADRKRLRVSYLVWSLAYFAAAIGATWLLSAPRYLAMLFPLAMTLCRLCRREHTERALEGALLVCQTVYLLMLGFDMPVY